MTDGDVTAGGRPTGEQAAVLRRRHVLVGAGAAVVLVACGDDDTTPQPAGDAAEPTASPEEPGAVSPDATADEETGDEEDESADEAVDGLVATADVPVGGGVILEGEGVVVTQPADGDFRAFSSTCTHQGCQVGDVSDGLIRCPCHGSRYFIEDGTVENGPATQPLPEVEITVEGDQVVGS